MPPAMHQDSLVRLLADWCGNAVVHHPVTGECRQTTARSRVVFDDAGWGNVQGPDTVEPLKAVLGRKLLLDTDKGLYVSDRDDNVVMWLLDACLLPVVLLCCLA